MAQHPTRSRLRGDGGLRNSPLTTVDVEEQMLELWERLERETEEFEDLAVDEAEKSALAKVEWAKEYLSAEGSIKNREAVADWRADKVVTEAKIAEALVRSKRERLNTLRAGLDALRTMAANARTSGGH